MIGFVKDLRFASRSLLRRPAFAIGAVLSLALGIGANTAIFTCVNAVLLRPLPVAEPERLMTVYTASADSPGEPLPLSYPNFRDYSDANEVFSSMLLFRSLPILWRGQERPEMIMGEIVSGNYFDVLGVKAALGRTFLPEEDRDPGSPPVVVLSHAAWQRRFGADPDVVGQVIHLNQHPFTVVGVAPEGFRGLMVLSSPELWVPVAMHQKILFGRLAGWIERRDGLFLNAAGRLAPGVTPERAEAALQTLARRLEQEYPVENKGMGISLEPLSQATLHHSIRDRFQKAGRVLLGLVGVLLLITCANVANLLLARALERRKEIAVRLSMGATRGRLVRQLIAEGLALSFAGGLIGLLVARLVRDLLWSFRPPMLPDGLDISLDAPVLAFTFLLCLLTGVLFGLVPLAQAFRFKLLSALNGSGTALPQTSRRLGLRHLLVMAQIALSFVSLAGSGLFLASLHNARQTDLGFNPENLALATIDLGLQGYSEPAGREIQRQLVERIATLPGVESTVLADRSMFDIRGLPRRSVALEGQETEDETRSMVGFNTVGPGYFEALGIPRLQGRDFTAADREDAPRVALVSESMAKQLWPGRSALGQRFLMGSDRTPVEVVGVVGDCKTENLRQTDTPFFYLSLLQTYTPSPALHVRAAGDPAAVMPSVRQVAKSLDGNLTLLQEWTLESSLEQALWAPRMTAGLLTAFGLLALLLAAAGVYSTMAFTVRSRFRELGIRTALGARRSDLAALLLREGALLVIGGIGLGALAAAVVFPRVSNLLFGSEDTRLVVFAAACLVLAAVSLLANLLPARRAMSVKASQVLWQE
jgi:predicted permease